MNIYENREYLIFNLNELPLVNFSEVLETNVDTVRKSVDGTKTFVKWNGDAPSFVNNMTTKEGPYTHTEILTILATPEWTNPIP